MLQLLVFHLVKFTVVFALFVQQLDYVLVKTLDVLLGHLAELIVYLSWQLVLQLLQLLL